MSTKISKHDLIITIVNRGFSDVVMDAAREKGATGGTIIHGKGTGARQLEFFHMILQDEKDIILIVASKDNRNAIMEGIMRETGLHSEAQGVVFTLPVEDFELLRKNHEENN